MATTNFSDWTKIFGEFKTPTVDVNQYISLLRRNAETGSTVMQIFTESAQANARHIAEIARSNAEHALKASKKLASHSSPESAAAEQADFFKTWLDFNVNSLRELAETSTKSTQEAFDVISKRVAEQVKEFSDVAGHAAPSKKKAA
jgi:phasin family protein